MMTNTQIVILAVNAGLLWIAYEWIHAWAQNRREQREHDLKMEQLKRGILDDDE